MLISAASLHTEGTHQGLILKQYLTILSHYFPQIHFNYPPSLLATPQPMNKHFPKSPSWDTLHKKNFFIKGLCDQISVGDAAHSIPCTDLVLPSSEQLSNKESNRTPFYFPHLAEYQILFSVKHLIISSILCYVL